MYDELQSVLYTRHWYLHDDFIAQSLIDVYKENHPNPDIFLHKAHTRCLKRNLPIQDLFFFFFFYLYLYILIMDLEQALDEATPLLNDTNTKPKVIKEKPSPWYIIVPVFGFAFTLG